MARRCSATGLWINWGGFASRQRRGRKLKLGAQMARKRVGYPLQRLATAWETSAFVLCNRGLLHGF